MIGYLMLKNLIIPLIAGLIFVGCGKSERDHDSTLDSSMEVTRNNYEDGFLFTADGQYSDEEWRIIKSNFKRTLQRYEQISGLKVPAINIIFTSDNVFLCGGTPVLGCTRIIPSDGVISIQVGVGDRLELPALWHEFCHATSRSILYASDPFHLDPGWKIWEDEQRDFLSIIR